MLAVPGAYTVTAGRWGQFLGIRRPRISFSGVGTASRPFNPTIQISLPPQTLLRSTVRLGGGALVVSGLQLTTGQMMSGVQGKREGCAISVLQGGGGDHRARRTMQGRGRG
jgi:hypothetical protein